MAALESSASFRASEASQQFHKNERNREQKEEKEKNNDTIIGMLSGVRLRVEIFSIFCLCFREYIFAKGPLVGF